MGHNIPGHEAFVPVYQRPAEVENMETKKVLRKVDLVVLALLLGAAILWDTDMFGCVETEFVSIDTMETLYWVLGYTLSMFSI